VQVLQEVVEYPFIALKYRGLLADLRATLSVVLYCILLLSIATLMLDPKPLLPIGQLRFVLFNSIANCESLCLPPTLTQKTNGGTLSGHRRFCMIERRSIRRT
jgi:hypothetical protein